MALWKRRVCLSLLHFLLLFKIRTAKINVNDTEPKYSKIYEIYEM